MKINGPGFDRLNEEHYQFIFMFMDELQKLTGQLILEDDIPVSEETLLPKEQPEVIENATIPDKDPDYSKEPWMQIPNQNWHREAIKLRWEGLIVPDISTKLRSMGYEVEPSTIHNVFTKLRKKYPKALPYKIERKKGKRKRKF